MLLKGTAHKLGDDVNTDYIIPSKYKSKFKDISEMSRYLLFEIDPGLSTRIQPGDFLVAGTNFGCGSSREAAPRVIQAKGLAAVLAVSFGRIFYRNAINIGLPVLECDTGEIAEGDKLWVDLIRNVVRNETKDIEIPIQPLPDFIQRILKEGGILKFLKKNSLHV